MLSSRAARTATLSSAGMWYVALLVLPSALNWIMRAATGVSRAWVGGGESLSQSSAPLTTTLARAVIGRRWEWAMGRSQLLSSLLPSAGTPTMSARECIRLPRGMTDGTGAAAQSKKMIS